MDRQAKILWLRELLLRDVTSLCQREDRLWSRAIVDTLRDIRQANVRAVFFGGTLRSLLLSRLQRGRFGRPRDVDIVVAGVNLDSLRAQFGEMITRETRFGGLQLRRMEWQFDVWPLQNTWAFLENGGRDAHFSELPSTTFFNLEAVAVDVWAPPGRRRSIYAGDGQFFDGIVDEVLEINQVENPFPALCIVRSLVLASSIGFAIGPRLARYLVRHAPAVDDHDLLETQRKHYGATRCSVDTMRRWLDVISERYAHNNETPIRLPQPRQMTLWPEADEPSSIKFHVLPDLGAGRG